LSSQEILIVVGVLLLFVLLFFVVFKSDLFSKNDYDKKYNNDNLDDEPKIPTDNEPVLTNHAKYRFSQRLGVDDLNEQKELANLAFKYGRTKNNTDGDLKATLLIRENSSDDCVAKFYSGSIYIFSKEDNVLKTVYKYSLNNFKN